MIVFLCIVLLFSFSQGLLGVIDNPEVFLKDLINSVASQ